MAITSDFSPTGSSPRVRGKLIQQAANELKSRIIPARAGQTLFPHPMRLYPTDHPRACGANRLISVAAVCLAGSSPRVRGKRGRSISTTMDIRIIPARAGQTRRWAKRTCNRSDHPRACGANQINADRGIAGAGSSPRVRGKLHEAAAHFGTERIIPARAGQT